MLKKDVEIIEAHLKAIEHYLEQIAWSIRYIRTEAIGTVKKN